MEWVINLFSSSAQEHQFDSLNAFFQPKEICLEPNETLFIDDIPDQLIISENWDDHSSGGLTTLEKIAHSFSRVIKLRPPQPKAKGALSFSDSRWNYKVTLQEGCTISITEIFITSSAKKRLKTTRNPSCLINDPVIIPTSITQPTNSSMIDITSLGRRVNYLTLVKHLAEEPTLYLADKKSVIISHPQFKKWRINYEEQTSDLYSDGASFMLSCLMFDEKKEQAIEISGGPFSWVVDPNDDTLQIESRGGTIFIQTLSRDSSKRFIDVWKKIQLTH